MRVSYFMKALVAVVFVYCTMISSTVLAESGSRELVLLNWSEYLDPDLVEKFQQKFNAKLKQVYYESDDLRDDMMLETDGKGYDLVLVNGIAINTYRKSGWLAPVSEQQVPNLKYVDKSWLNAFPGVNGYAAPYFWGTVGIAYRADLVEKAPTSWMDIFQPAQYLRGKITMVKNSRDVLGMALKALGYSANSVNPMELKKAEQLLITQKPYVKTYTYLTLNEESALVTGDVFAAMMYSGDALMAQEYNENIQYIVPKEGGNLWVDYLAVLEGSKNKDLAWAFINFLNEPENAAQLAEFVHYATPNKAAEKLLPNEFLKDPNIYPSQEVIAKSECYTPLPARVAKQRNNAFARVMQVEVIK